MIINKFDWETAEKTAEILRGGNIAIIPTDTIYGFSGIVPDTEQKIREPKDRSDKKPFIRLLAKPEDVFLYTDIRVPPALLAFWPGPLTLVVPTSVVSIAFRCPGDEWLRNVIAKTGKPLYSTSANRAGQSPFSAIKDIIREFESTVSLIVAAGDCANSRPSTIVDITSGTCKVLREGSIKLTPELLEAANRALNSDYP
jgi:L-threonylcarbamoyladenylate synthase